MQIIQELRNYGLSEKESQVYLSLLKRGASTAKDISEECKLIRTSLYDVLNSLKNRGIIFSTLKNKISYFEAAEPQKLIDILEEKKTSINQVLPELRSLRSEKIAYPKGEIFEGIEGVKAVFNEILRDNKPICAFSNNTAMLEILPYFAHHFILERVKRKIPIKIISEPSRTTNEELTKKDKKQFRETRTLQELSNIKINEYITDDFVALLGSKADEPIGIIIRQEGFVQLQKMLFEKAWKLAKK